MSDIKDRFWIPPRWFYCRLVLCVVLMLPATKLLAQVPPESQLPGSKVTNRTDPPSEADLPGDRPRQDRSSTAGEADLPGVDKNAKPIQSSTALASGLQPWLRMDFEGHTGIVRAIDLSGDSETLFSGGEDKDLHIWRRSNFAKTNWLHRRTVRWQITRGPRGRIYAIASRGDEVAMAGHGALGGLGEIWIVDAKTGNLNRHLVDVENGHRQVVQSLAWAPGDNPCLASQDVEGRVMIWKPDEQSGTWFGRELVARDAIKYGPATAEKLKPFRQNGSIVFSGEKHLVVPQLIGFTEGEGAAPWWQLNRINIDTNEDRLLAAVNHWYAVTDLDASQDGGRLVSGDESGATVIWTLNKDDLKFAPKSIACNGLPLCLDLDEKGTRLLLGTAGDTVDASKGARLQLWDTVAEQPAMLSERVVSRGIPAEALNVKDREAIIASDNRIEIYAFDEAFKFDAAPPRVLEVPIQPQRKVAFAKAGLPYRIAFGSEFDDAKNPILENVFDLSAVKLEGRGEIDDADYLPAQRTDEHWTTGVKAAANDASVYLKRGDTLLGRLPLRNELHGLPIPSADSTIPKPREDADDPNAKPETAAVVIGTSGRNNIYVYAADESDPPRLLRQFRGHTGWVLSTSTSADGKYLVSGGDDATICVWNLADLLTAGESVNRWGVEFAVAEGQLIAERVREDGPLYFRGVRSGDRLVSINWANDVGEESAETDPKKMRQRLLELPFDTLVVFNFTRLGRAIEEFQSFAAWRPLATLFVDRTREWAFWSPAGYYDASFNGHQRFGWQINQGVNRLPDYFRAAQFRKLLERPDVMRRLLAAGSLPAAMRMTVSQLGPPPGEAAIVNQYLIKPQIKLLSPEAGDVIDGDTLTVRAEITVPLGATLVPPKAFVSGVPAVRRREIQHSDPPQYEWTFRLPSDPRLQLEVLAATESEAFDRVMIDLEHKSDGVRRARRLHILAIGASEYRDPQIQTLDFAANAAAKVVDLFRQQSSSIYEITSNQLINDDATRPLWRVFAQQAAEQLSESVGPDDLVVMYLCGHGLRDRRTDQWYFVTADARYSDLMNDEYADCIAFSDLAALAQLPCRKLAILDSCHSGAVQPVMRSDDLKSAMRFLQDDVVLTVAASEGDEEAAEKRESGLGRFTERLVDGLLGKADEAGNQNGEITLTEAIDYVTRTVSEESEQEGMPQHPTASPQYLLRTLQELPLTTVAK